MSSIEMLKEFSFFDYVLTFFILSIVGWTVETTYCSIGARKFVNRGFLTGPLCPIYGTGAVVFMVTLTRFYSRWYVVLLLGILLADTVEYITSFLMEKLFHARWWDYSEEFLNINGRICLKHTCYWGIAALVYIYIFQPFYLKVYLMIPATARYIALGIIFAIFLVDLANAVKNAIDVRKFMHKIHAFTDSVSAFGEDMKAKFSESKESFGAKFTIKISSFYRQLDEIKAQTQNKKISKEKKKEKQKNRMYQAYGNLQNTVDKTVQYAEEILEEIKKRITDDDEEMF